MRPADIDRTVTPWEYRPFKHKTENHDIERVIPLGPKARALIEPFLDRPAESFLFSPAEAEAERRDLEAAQIVLGHSSQRMAAQYAEVSVAKAYGVIEEIG